MIIYLDTKATPHRVSSASISHSRGVVEEKEEEEGEKCGLLANCSIAGGGGWSESTSSAAASSWEGNIHLASGVSFFPSLSLRSAPFPPLPPNRASCKTGVRVCAQTRHPTQAPSPKLAHQPTTCLIPTNPTCTEHNLFQSIFEEFECTAPQTAPQVVPTRH